MSPLFGAGLTSPAGIPKATVNATTGSPTTNNNARAGKTVYQFNGSGSITIGTAGTAEVLVLGGGGGGGQRSGGFNGGGGGGAGALIHNTSALLPEGTHTIVVGGGAGETNYAFYSTLNTYNNGLSQFRLCGTPSSLGNLFYAIGGAGSRFSSTNDGN